MATLDQDVLALATAKDRAARKVQWFMQNLAGRTFTSGARTVTLDSFALRDGILDIYVALNVGGTPVGLGPKNVRFERIRIANPPIMIVTGLDVDGNPIKQLGPLQAIRETVAHAIKLIATGKRPDSMDSRGDSTLIVYPDAGSGATTVDGYANRGGVNQTFSAIHDGAGTGAGVSDGAAGPQLVATTTSNQYSSLLRMILTFDTSPLGLFATISTGVLSLYGSSKASGLGSPAIHACASTPASNNIIVAADYSQLGTTTFANIAYASFSSTAYNDFSLDSNGIANISLTSISKFGTRLSWDINNSFTGTWVSTGQSYIYYRHADTAGTTQDPKLTITYTVPSSSGGFPMSNAWRFFRRP